MQCRYVGDIGDFGKYGLLRAMCSEPPFKLGVVWYLVADESHNNDGNYISYLCNCNRMAVNLKVCDEKLYIKLQKIVLPLCQGNNMHESSGIRSVEKIHDEAILPQATFFDEILSFSNLRGRAEKIERRNNWLSKAIQTVKNCNIVFIDPDNGINLNNHAYRKKGPKYTFFNELEKFRCEALNPSEEKRSLIIYHHSNFSETVDSQIDNQLQTIRERLNCPNPFALRYHRGTSRTFFIVPGSEQASKSLYQKTECFLRKWGVEKRGVGKHFTFYKLADKS